MAGVLLDSIINETIHKSFGGNDLLEESLLKELQESHHDNKFSIPALASTSTTSSTTQNTNLAFVNRDNTDSSSAISDQLDSLSQQPWQNVEMGQNERLFWVLIFSIMVFVAAGGNTIVVYIVSTNKEMKSVTNYFLVNLSLADTMVSTLNVIFNFISMLLSHWPFGKIYCKISNFIAILSISASVFTLTAISCDRYNAILHPLRPRMSHRHAIGWILLIWTLSSALAMPNAIYSTLVEDRLVNDNVAVTCAMVWPDGRYPLSSYDHIYNIVVLVVTYLVPIITMAILYYKVGKELWGYEAIGENIDKQQRALMAKKKIVKMMIVVVIIFALCWLPYHAFFVVNYYVPTIFQDVPLHYQRCYLFMYWLAMSNSMYNPIIIYFMNSNFRREFRKILCLLFCCRVNIPPIRSNVNNTNNNNNNNNYNSTYNINNTNTTNNKSFVNHAKRQSSQDSQRNLKRILTVEDKNNHVDLAAAQNTHDNDVEIVIEEDEREGSNENIEISSKNSENCRQSIEFTRNQNIEGYGKKEIEEEGEPFIAYKSKTETHKNDLNKINEKLIQFATNKQTTAITNKNNNSTNSNFSSNKNNTSTTNMVKNSSSDESNNHKVWI